MSRHEEFCWWLGGFLASEAHRSNGPSEPSLVRIAQELANALHGAKVQQIMEPGDGLTARTLESLGGPWRKTIDGRSLGDHVKTVVGVDLGSKPSETVYSEFDPNKHVGSAHGRIGVAYDGMQHQVARAPLSVLDRVAVLEVQACNTQHNEKLSCADRQKLSDRIKSLEDKPRGVLVSAFDLLNNHVHKLEKRLYDLEQLPKPGETYREAFTRGWDNAKDKVASLNEHQQKQAREQGKLGDRIGELEAQLKKAQDMAGSMHDDKERRLKRLEVPDTQRHIRDLQRWQSGVNTSLHDIKAKADVSSEVIQNLNKRLHDVEQAVAPGHRPAPANSLPGIALRVLTLEGHADPQRQGQLDAAFMAQRGHVGAGIASALNNQAMSRETELHKHRETFAPEKRTRGGMNETFAPHIRDLQWNEHSDDSAQYLSRPRGIGDPEDRS